MTNQEFQLKKMTLAVRAMFGLAAIVAAFGFLIQSTSPAQADAPTTINEAGRYQMQMNTVYTGTKSAFYMLVWDTSTGRSKFYLGDTKSKITAAPTFFNLPSSPL